MLRKGITGFAFAALLLCTLLSCNGNTNAKHSNEDTLQTMHDSLLRVKSYLEINVDSNGNLPKIPYIIVVEAGSKTLVVIGTQHTNDTTSVQFDRIESCFYQYNPQIIINEGGELKKTYTDKNLAIRQSGELGLEKYLADKKGIKTVCGDEPEAQEFKELSEKFSSQEALLYFASERFMFPYIFGEYEGDLEKLYSEKFISGYLKKRNVQITPEQETFAYYKSSYEKWFGYPFHIDSLRQSDFVPIRNKHHFCEVSRSSKQLRDRYLVKAIRNELASHNCVMVVYGGWHVLAIEDALPQIMNEYGSPKVIIL